MLFKGNSTSLQLIIEKLQSNKGHRRKLSPGDTLGTEGGSSWASEEHTTTTTSPSSSCATPNSATEGADSELSFTVGVTDGTPHACRFCDKAFPRHSYLKKHEQTHADCMPFRCEYCRRLFKHKRSRDRHIKLHTGDKKYRCSQCEAAFSRSDHLKIHMKTHDNQKPFQCTVCNRGYNTAAALTSHIQNHKKSSENSASNGIQAANTYKCLQCAEIFKKPEELQKHMETHPASENTNGNKSSKNQSNSLPPMRYTCSYCTKDNFATMEAMQDHVQSAHKSVLNGDLQKDLRSLPQERTPTSTSLSKQMLDISALKSSLPPQLPPYYCELCTMRFSSLPSLHKHIITVHNFNNRFYNNETKYALTPSTDYLNNGRMYCVYCAIEFITPASFAEHYILFHSPYTSQLLATPPITEQLKPTDLSLGRKSSPTKRNGEDQRSSPRKRSRQSGDRPSSTSSTSHSNSSAHNRYEYPGTLLCSQCNAACSDFESFRTHIKIHIEETGTGLLGGSVPLNQMAKRQENICPHCRSIFSSFEELSQHIAIHFLSTDLEFMCENCRMSYEKLDDLQRHLMDSHSHHLYSCTICNEVFESKVTIQVHFSMAHNVQSKVYKCKSCSPSSTTKFRSETDFFAHVRTAHAENLNAVVPPAPLHSNFQTSRCSICHTVFPSELELQLHLAVHGKQFQCSLCSQSFHIEYLLDKHMQSHQNAQVSERSYKTNSAKMSPNTSFESYSKKAEYNNNNNSKNDCNVVSSERTPYCDLCDKREFNTETEVLAHKRLVHNISPLTSYPKSNGHLMNGEILNGRNRKLSPPSTSESKSEFLRTKYDPSLISSDVVNNAIYCDICEKKGFANESELASHKKSVHHMKVTSPGKLSLHCAYCNENCKSRSELENHMKTHSNSAGSSGKHKCIICDEMYPTAAVLAEHKLTHCKVLAGKTCMHCKGSISTEEQFYCHILPHSRPPSVNESGGNIQTILQQLVLPAVCVICRQTLVSEVEVRMHARFHLQQCADTVPCSVCYQTVDRQDLLAGICKECYQRHGKSSPFRCPECHMNFENGAAIEIHMANVHMKMYQCTKCQVSFENEKAIQQHVSSHLMIDGSNSHQCRLCALVFPTSVQLEAHLIEHTFAGCSTFTCYLCSSVFTTSQGLQNHMLNHGLSAKPYDCTHCGQKFFFAAELEHHSYIHIEDKNFNSEGYIYHKKSQDQYKESKNSAERQSNNFPNDEKIYKQYKNSGDQRPISGRRQQEPELESEFNESSVNENESMEYYQNQKSEQIQESKRSVKQERSDSEEEQIDVVTMKHDSNLETKEI